MLTFVTGNKNKLAEALAILGDVQQLDVEVHYRHHCRTARSRQIWLGSDLYARRVPPDVCRDAQDQKNKIRMRRQALEKLKTHLPSR